MLVVRWDAIREILVLIIYSHPLHVANKNVIDPELGLSPCLIPHKYVGVDVTVAVNSRGVKLHLIGIGKILPGTLHLRTAAHIVPVPVGIVRFAGFLVSTCLIKNRLELPAYVSVVVFENQISAGRTVGTLPFIGPERSGHAAECMGLPCIC